jgi:hypothetical protein
MLPTGPRAGHTTRSKIVFLHGWHSVPGGLKPTYLIEHGHEVINPALDDDDLEQAARPGRRSAVKRPHLLKNRKGSQTGFSRALTASASSGPNSYYRPARKTPGG